MKEGDPHVLSPSPPWEGGGSLALCTLGWDGGRPSHAPKLPSASVFSPSSSRFLPPKLRQG